LVRGFFLYFSFSLYEFIKTKQMITVEEARKLVLGSARNF